MRFGELTILSVDICIRADSNKQEWIHELARMPFDVHRMKEFARFQRNLLRVHLRQCHAVYIYVITVAK